MKRIKFSIALITMFGLLLGTASIASAKTTSPVHQAKASRTSAKSTSSKANSVHKTVKHTTKHITKNA
jgi:hypothetical protein